MESSAATALKMTDLDLLALVSVLHLRDGSLALGGATLVAVQPPSLAGLEAGGLCQLIEGSVPLFFLAKYFAEREVDVRVTGIGFENRFELIFSNRIVAGMRRLRSLGELLRALHSGTLSAWLEARQSPN